jgi:predicted metal-dependent phosphotriesterase family hydrolase
MVRIDRRHLLRLFAAAGGVLPMAYARTGVGDAAPLHPGALQNSPPTPGAGAIVRTVLKDLPPETLGAGAVLFHEHLSVDFQRGKPGSSVPDDDIDSIVTLVRKAGATGVSCIVDGGHPDMGRSRRTLQQVATRSGVHIVASGGYYTQATYPPEVAAKTDDQIAADLVQLAKSERHGAFGEIGQAPNLTEMTADERKVFRAVGKAHVRTGLPIFTHNPYGTGANVPRDSGLRQLDVLESVGVKPAHVAIGHVCCLDDPKADVMKQIARRGAFVGFDRLTYIQFVSDEKKVTMLLAMLEAGLANQVLLSSDFPGWRNTKPWVPTLEEGFGWERTLTVFVPKLRKAGVPEATLQNVLVQNPRRFLAFVPVAT